MKTFAKRMLGVCGLDVRFVRNLEAAEAASWEQKQDALWNPFLQHRNIKTVIDVGANIGQFASMIHRQCPAARILCFEPLPRCQPDLKKVLRDIPGSKIFEAAVGEYSGTARINASDFSPCSSLLTGTSSLGEDYPSAAITTCLDVPVVRIDDAVCHENIDDEILVKFDVQGFEIQAMKGAGGILKRASIVICEVCFFRKLYEGQPLFDEIHGHLSELGFTYMGNAEQHLRKSDGRVVEADAVFERIDRRTC